MSEHYQSKERVRALGEVFTPEVVAMQMLNMSELSFDPDKTLLEPSCGKGVFLRLALRGRMISLAKRWPHLSGANGRDFASASLDCLRNMYGIDIDDTNVDTARRNVYEEWKRSLKEHGVRMLTDDLMNEAESILADNIVCADALTHPWFGGRSQMALDFGEAA